MGGIWASQDSMRNLPEIRVIDSVPQINISGPDESSFIAPDRLPIATQSQVNVHYPHADEDAFDTFQPQSNSTFSNTFAGGIDGAPPLTMAWNNSDPFAPAAPVSTSSFSDFDFNSDPSISYTQFMGLEDPNGGPRHVTVNSHLDAFNNTDSRLTEPLSTSMAPADADHSIEDPTHADVHALLQEHYNTTLQMLSMCMQSCEHATGENDMVKNVVMKNLQLLKTWIQASSECHHDKKGSMLTS